MVVNLLSAILIVTVFVFVLGTLLFSHHILSLDHGMLLVAQTDSSESPFLLASLIEQGSPFLGDPSAPVTIIDFSDFHVIYVQDTKKILSP